jgi:hypothetical protein
MGTDNNQLKATSMADVMVTAKATGQWQTGTDNNQQKQQWQIQMRW